MTGFFVMYRENFFKKNLLPLKKNMLNGLISSLFIHLDFTVDFQLTLLNFTDADLQLYLSEIKKSNLPKAIQWELTDLLNTAQTQINEARNMGWLPA